MSNKLAAWNLKQLFEAYQQDLLKCHTDFERSMVSIVCKKEMIGKAQEWSKTRKLTPAEVAILEKL